MNTKVLFSLAIVSGWPLAVIAATPETNSISTNGNGALSLDWVVRTVLSNNPALKSARADWLAAKERIPQAAAWESPRVGVDVERSGTTRPFTYSETEWMVSQEIPFSGRNRLRARVAAADADASLSEVRRRELDTVAAAKTAYFRLANAGEQLEFNRRNLSLWERYATLARGKYELGTHSQADLILAETELARVNEGLIENQHRITASQARLNALLNQPLGTALDNAILPDAPPPLPAAASLEEIARSRRPEFVRAEKRIHSARTRVELAKKEWIPDPELRVEARQFNGTGRFVNEYDTGIFFKFPWLNRGRHRAAVNEARSGQDGAERELEAVFSETAGLIGEGLSRIEAARRQHDLFRNRLLPLARRTIEARRIGYETDRNGFLDLLIAQKDLQEIESASRAHLAESHIALAELEAVLGAPLPTSIAKKPE